MEDLAIAEVSLAQTWRETFTPRDRRPIPDWAHDFIWLSPPITKTGWFDVSGSRHWIPIFASLQDDRKREVNLLKPVRGGGSLIGDVFCPWTICNDPGPYMDVFQTDKVANDHAEERIKRIFDQCEPLKKLLPSNRHQERNNEILFSNGHTWYVRGPSLANLQAKGIRRLRLEEVWMWDQGKMGEAEGRIGDYLKMQTSMILRISQGGPKDGVEMTESDWFKAYHRGQVLEWEVQCLNQACGKYFDPIFGGTRPDGSFWGMTWDRHMLPNGDWDIPKAVPTTRFECPHCAHPMMDSPRTKAEWNRTGQYRLAKEGNPKRDSFHYECVIDFPWEELVELWLQACNCEKRGDLKPKIQFYQKRRAMFMDEESLLKRGLNLRRAIYEIDPDCPKDGARFLAVDRQEEDLFWWEVRDWLPGETRRLGFGKCYGFGEVEALRIKFKVEPNRTFIDSGYNPKGDHGVYAACAKYGWIAVRGAGEHSFTHTLKRRSGQAPRRVQKSYAELAFGDPETGTYRRRCPLIRFSKFQMNQKVKELIENGHWKEPMPGTAAALDPEMEKEYNAQMAARVKKVEYNARTGESKVFFKEAKNDHAADLANMQCLGGVLSEKIPDPAEERLTRSEASNLNPQSPIRTGDSVKE